MTEQNAATETLRCALWYIKAGWEIFPVKPSDKTPLVKWAEEATRNEKTVREWINRWPNMNIGVATGKRSGFFALDIDAGHGGEESLLALVAEYGKIPDTNVSLTGGGGQHYLFVHPGGEIRNSAGKFPGIDVRGDGGYIVVPPSLHPSGRRYMWEESSKPGHVPMGRAPQWVLDTFQTKSQPKPAPAQQADSRYVVGGRNAALTSLAGTMRRRGMSETAILAAITSENEARCTPPLDAAEVAQIVKSVCRYEPTAQPEAAQPAERMRIEVEYLLVSAAYHAPDAARELIWMKPELILDAQARKFWSLLMSGLSATDAAVEAGILDQLTKYKSDTARIGEYANTIARMGYLSVVNASYSDIKRFSDAGDVGKVQQIIRQLNDQSPITTKKPKTSTDGLLDLISAIQEEGKTIVKTRVGNFDEQTGGLGLGDVSVWAARPSVGKSTLAFQIARNAASDGERAMFFSLEMLGRHLWAKAACGIAEVSWGDVLSKRISAEKREYIIGTVIPDLITAYDDRLTIVDDVWRVEDIQRMVMQGAPSLVVIDHLGFVIGGDDKSLVNRLGEVMKEFKKLAKLANCHIMILCQLSRGVESRDNKRPTLSDLRDSGHIEQDADMVITMYRADYYEEKGTRDRYNETELIVRKNRNGESGFTVLQYYDMLQQWFYRQSDTPVVTVKLNQGV